MKVRDHDATDSMLQNFAEKYYTEIMERLVEVCDETGLEKTELLLELDFKPNKHTGVAPALQDPPNLPEFKISEARKYFEGSRENEPDWFSKSQDEDTYQQNILPIVSGLKDQYANLSEKQLLCLIRYPVGASCTNLQMEHQGTNEGIFTNDAVAAFRCAIHDGNFTPLSKILDEDNITYYRNRYGYIDDNGNEEKCGIATTSSAS